MSNEKLIIIKLSRCNVLKKEITPMSSEGASMLSGRAPMLSEGVHVEWRRAHVE